MKQEIRDLFNESILTETAERYGILKDQVEFVRLFFTHFMLVYRKENGLDPWWDQHIPDFLRLRHMCCMACSISLWTWTI